MITPMLTSTKANSVPMLTSLTISLSGTSAARMAISTPKPMVSRAGVPYRWFTAASRAGSRPSRHMAKKMRVWPYMMTSTTLVIATTAPSDSTAAAQLIPAPSSSAAASGASLPDSVSGLAMPIAPTAVST
jgi:hypothetical protein